MEILSNEIKPWIAVHLHLYYEDLLKEFCSYLDHITEPFDLYISCKMGADQRMILNETQNITNVKSVVVKETINRGRDIAPFYVLFREELLQYEVLLHIHSKKSLYSGKEKVDWRHWALDGVLKDRDSVAHMLYLLAVSQPKAGLLYGEMTETLTLPAFCWSYNAGKGKELLNRLHMKYEDKMFMYPVGSFFWARTEAIRPLFDLNLTYEDFDEEKGQIDGTLAHALERVVSLVVEKQGFPRYIFDPSKGTYARNVSYGRFEEYFTYTPKNLSALLNTFDIVTFAVFGTLITRTVYQESDIFRFMKRKIGQRYGITVDFEGMREQAKEIAIKKWGDFCDIDHIYEELELISPFTHNQIEEMKKMEMDLEYETSIPREDARKVFCSLVHNGRRIQLISDTYLTRSVVEKILKKCGYEGYEDIWLPCETGKRKDTGSVWDSFYAQYGEKRTIHVGSNPFSDCQIVSDKGKIPMLWLSPGDQFRFSEEYERFCIYEDTSWENSLVLGHFVNEYAYNSPFALKASGTTSLNAEEAVGGLLAPLFLAFAQFVARHAVGELIFLSESGDFLQKVYKEYCNYAGISEMPNQTLYASRRTVFLPQIENLSDIKEVLEIRYKGYLSEILQYWFAVRISPEEDFEICLPQDIDRVLVALARNAQELFKEIEEKRSCYTGYLNSCIKEGNECVTLVGLTGFAIVHQGLQKLVGKTFRGCYLMGEPKLMSNKLQELCDCTYILSENCGLDGSDIEMAISNHQEKVLKMEYKNNGFVPIFEGRIESCVLKRQNAILNYISRMGKYVLEGEFDIELAMGLGKEYREKYN